MADPGTTVSILISRNYDGNELSERVCDVSRYIETIAEPRSSALRAA
jgi:hypothetical protein